SGHTLLPNPRSEVLTATLLSSRPRLTGAHRSLSSWTWSSSRTDGRRPRQARQTRQRGEEGVAMGSERPLVRVPLLAPPPDATGLRRPATVSPHGTDAGAACGVSDPGGGQGLRHPGRPGRGRPPGLTAGGGSGRRVAQELHLPLPRRARGPTLRGTLRRWGRVPAGAGIPFAGRPGPGAAAGGRRAGAGGAARPDGRDHEPGPAGGLDGGARGGVRVAADDAAGGPGG